MDSFDNDRDNKLEFGKPVLLARQGGQEQGVLVQAEACHSESDSDSDSLGSEQEERESDRSIDSDENLNDEQHIPARGMQQVVEPANQQLENDDGEDSEEAEVGYEGPVISTNLKYC